MAKHTLKVLWCSARFLKYVWPFLNITKDWVNIKYVGGREFDDPFLTNVLILYGLKTVFWCFQGV